MSEQRAVPNDPTPRSDSRKGKAERTVAKLYEATIDLIVERGWEHATSRSVAERAGVSLGVVHYHAESIVALRREAATSVLAKYFAGLADTAMAFKDPAAAVRALFANLSSTDQHQRELAVLYQSLVAAPTDEQLRESLALSVDSYRAMLTDFLTAHRVADPFNTAVTIIAVADGYLVQRALDPTLSPAPIVEVLTKLVTTTG